MWASFFYRRGGGWGILATQSATLPPPLNPLMIIFCSAIIKTRCVAIDKSEEAISLAKHNADRLVMTVYCYHI